MTLPQNSSPAIIHITIGVTNHLRIRAKLKAVQHDPAGLGHDAFRFGNGAVDVVDRGFDQEGVMHRSTDLDATLRGHAASETEHFRPVALHGEVGETSRVGVMADMDTPAEHCVQPAMQHGMIDRRV